MEWNNSEGKQNKKPCVLSFFDNPFSHCPHTPAITNIWWEASIQGSLSPFGSLSQIIILVQFLIIHHISTIMHYLLFADF